MSDFIDVVAAVIYHHQHNTILLSRRGEHQHQGGKWEFPGGKVEPGESLLAALSRELVEELGVHCNLAQPLLTIEHHYPQEPAQKTAQNPEQTSMQEGEDTKASAAKSVRLHFFEVRDWQGAPQGREGQAIDWVAIDDLAVRDFPVANRALVKALELGEQLLVWPDTLPTHWELRLHLAMQRGVRLVYARGLEDPTLLHQIAAICHQHNARLLVANDVELMRAVNADGLHLQAHVAQALKVRPEVPLLSVACHNADELRQAQSLSADMVVLAPVNATRSHPGAASLGWPAVAVMAKTCPQPIFALGGVGPSSLPVARANGAYGVAGISAFWPPEQLLHGL